MLGYTCLYLKLAFTTINNFCIIICCIKINVFTIGFCIYL